VERHGVALVGVGEDHAPQRTGALDDQFCFVAHQLSTKVQDLVTTKARRHEVRNSCAAPPAATNSLSRTRATASFARIDQKLFFVPSRLRGESVFRYTAPSARKSAICASS